jgi:hypothetical protein
VFNPVSINWNPGALKTGFFYLLFSISLNSATRSSSRLRLRLMLCSWSIPQVRIFINPTPCVPSMKRAAYMICPWVWSALKNCIAL